MRPSVHPVSVDLVAAGSVGNETVGNPMVNLLIFALFVAATLVIVVRVASGNRTAADYYAGGRAFTGRQNGIAIGGDYLSAASFLGIAGAIATRGYDGFLYSIGFLVAWLLTLLVVAEPLRNTGRFTMADVLSFRLRQGPVRTAAAISTLFVCLIYLIAQMAGAGALVSLLLGVSSTAGQSLTIVVVGLLMIFYVLVGGMKGTTWVQIVKAVLLMLGAGLMTAWVLQRSGLNLSWLLGEAAAAHPQGREVLAPGVAYGATTTSKIDFVSLSLALVLGTAALPHVLMRLYTVPNAREARRSVTWAIWLIGSFYLFTLVLGYGAMAMVGPDKILAAPGKANSAAPLLAFEIGGTLLLGVIAAVAFATILAVVAGLTITASASFAHDIYAQVLKGGEVEPEREIRAARITAVVVGVLAIGGGMLAIDQNVAFLVSLAFAVAASANLPTILYSLFWRRFTTRGALWSIYGGLVTSVGLILLSPVVSGKVDPVTGTSLSMIKDTAVDFSWFPLENPGIVAIPVGFALGWLGSITSAERPDSRRYARMAVRGLTGAGAEKARAK